MDAKTQARLRSRAAIMKGIAHPSRLFILEQLETGEKTVGELTKMIGADISTVSKHLLVMKNLGIIEDDKRGAQVFYRLKCPCIMSFFSCAEEVIKTATHGVT